MDFLAVSYDAFVAPEPREQTLALYGVESVVCNALMGSRPAHPFWLLLLERIAQKLRSEECSNAVFCTGPMMMQSVYAEYIMKHQLACSSDDITKLPSEFFYPEIAKYNQDHIRSECRKKGLNCENFVEHEPMFAFHHWAGEHHRKHTNQIYGDITEIIPAQQFKPPFP